MAGRKQDLFTKLLFLSFGECYYFNVINKMCDEFSTDEDEEKKCVETKRKWTRAETSAFLTAYAERRAEFIDPLMKQNAMKNVLSDLKEQAALTTPTSIGMLKSKLKNLRRTYKNGKNNSLKTPLQNQLDAIFGKRQGIDKNNYLENSEMLDIDDSTIEDDESEESECIETRRKWTHEETVAFLTAYAERKDEFLHVLQKKTAMEKVLNDLINRAVLTQPTTVEMLNTKIKSLWRAYKHAKIYAIKTGTSQASIAYEDQLEAIFGDRATESNKHSERQSERPLTTFSLAIPENHDRRQISTREEHIPKMKNKSYMSKYLENKLKLREQFFERKIQMKKTAELNKQKRHVEKIKMLHKYLDKFRNEK